MQRWPVKYIARELQICHNSCGADQRRPSSISSIPFFSKLRSQKHYLQLVKPELKQVSEFVEAQASCFDPEVTDYMETVCQSKGEKCSGRPWFCW